MLIIILYIMGWFLYVSECVSPRCERVSDSDTVVVIYSIMARVLCLLVCVRLLIRVLWGGHGLILFNLLYNG